MRDIDPARRLRITLLRVALAAGAFLCGLRVLGYWVILRIGGAQPADRGEIALGACGWAFLFALSSFASAWIGEGTSGARATGGRALFFTGAHGLAPIALFAVVSAGAVLRMPEVIGLAVVFVCFVVVFRPRMAQGEW
jgi:hypothetical protein